MSDDEQRADPPRDPVAFARGVAEELEHIAEHGFIKVHGGKEFRCSEKARKRARERAVWWREEAERRAAQAQRNRET